MVDTPVPPPYPIASGTNTVNVIPPATGMFTLRIYDSTGLLLAQTEPFSVAQHLPHTYTVSAADVASLVEATNAILRPADGVFDAISLGDTASVSIRFAGAASDTLTLGDVAANNGTLLIEEVVTLTEDASANMEMTSSASDSLVLLEAPVGAISGGTGGLLNITFKIKNVGSASIVKPQVTIGHPFAPGDVPAGYRLALYDSTGTTQNTNFQQDMDTPWLQDGSLKFASLSFVSPDTFTAGQTITYTLKAELGVPNRTPNVSMTQLKTLLVSHDVAWNFYGVDLGADTYKVSLQDIVTSFKPLPWNPILSTNSTTASGTTLHFANTTNVSVGLRVTGTNIPANTSVVGVTTSTVTLSASVTGTGVPNGSSITFQYPFGGWQVVKSGPVCTEYRGWSFLRRVSDGAFHGWQKAALFVRYWGTTGPIEVATRLQRSNLYGAMPGTTLGVNDQTAQYTYLSYGGSTVYTWGGTADPNNFTIPATSFNVANSYVTLPWNPSYIGAGGMGVTFTSTGALPGGIDPNRVYYLTKLPVPHPANDTTANWLLCFYRSFVSQAQQNNLTLITWSPGLTIPNRNYYIVQNGFVYIPYLAGGKTATTGSGPTGSADFQHDGTVTWRCAGIQFTSQGSGTITANMTIGTWQNTGFSGMTQTCNRVWIPGTSGAVQPQLSLEHNFDYLVAQSRAVPCFDPSIASQLSYMLGPCIPYIGNLPRLSAATSPFFLAGTGDGLADERIGYINPSSANVLYNQLDPVADQYARLIGLLWDDYYLSADDERSGQPAATNFGPNRDRNNPGSYPGLAPVNGNLSYLIVGGVYGTPQWIGGPNATNDSGHAYNYAQMLDASHTPIPWYVPYLRTGDPLYYDIGRCQAANMIASLNWNGTRNVTTNTGVINPHSGTQTYGGVVTGFNQQARSWGWIIKAIGCSWHVMPSADPLYPYIKDCLDDSAAFLDVIPAAVTTEQANMGWVPIVLPAGTFAGTELWENSIMFLCVAMEAWRGERPQWGTFLKNYFVKQMPAVLDTAQGGCEGAADAQWIIVSASLGANFGTDFYQTPLAVWQATYPGENWTSTTCSNHTGMLDGLKSGLSKWVPMTAPVQPHKYWAMAHAACAMGGVCGITLCSELAERIIARTSQISPIHWADAPQKSSVTNYVKWAIFEPENHS